MMAGLADMTTEQLLALRQKTVADTAINKNESNGAPDTAAGIVNPASGARGNMQVEPATAASPGFGVKPSNGTPADDARMGRDYRAALQQHYGDPETAAIAYNWGPGNTDHWIANGRDLSKLPTETLKYLKGYKATIAAAGEPPGQTAPPAGQQPAQQAPVNPAMNTMPANWQPPGGFMMGMGDTIGGALRAIIHGGSKVASAVAPGSSFANDIAQAEQQIDATRQAESAKYAQANPNAGTDVPRVLGSIAPALAIPAGAPSTLLGAAAAGAGGGALMGAAQTQPGQDYTQQMLTGGAAGAAGGAAGGILGKIIGGANVSPAVRSLMAQGVTPTPGQALGGVAKAVEEKATSIPIVGDAIQSAQRAAQRQANTAMYQSVLDPIGEAAPTTVGRDAIAQVKDTISGRYNTLLPKLTFKADVPLLQELIPVQNAVNRIPDQALRDDFAATMDRAFMSQLDSKGEMSGQAFKDAEQMLTTRALQMNGKNDPFYSDTANALLDARGALRNALARSNPNDAPELQAINDAWGRYKILENAGARVNNPEMPIMPGQMQAAVKARAVANHNPGSFASGSARMQGLTDPAMAVLGNRYPDSGTTGRFLASRGLENLATGLGAATMAPGAAIAGGAATGLYGTNLGRQAMLAAIARRPEFARLLGRGLLAGSPQVGAAADLATRNDASQ